MVAGLAGKSTVQMFNVTEEALKESAMPNQFGQIKHVQFFDELPEYCSVDLTLAPTVTTPIPTTEAPPAPVLKRKSKRSP